MRSITNKKPKRALARIRTNKGTKRASGYLHPAENKSEKNSMDTKFKAWRDDKIIIGEIALRQIELEIAEAGWISQGIVGDYGEDLFVQTTKSHRDQLASNVDVFKTLIQAKGTNSAIELATGTWSMPIDKEHLIRWLNCREPVVFVMWDHKTETGRFCVPKKQFNLVDIIAKPTASHTLHFDPNDVFKKERLFKLGWELRIDYYTEVIMLGYTELIERKRQYYNNTPISNARRLHGTHDSNSHAITDNFVELANEHLNTILDYFLDDLDLIHDNTCSTIVKNTIEDYENNFDPPEPETSWAHEACEHVIRMKSQELSNYGISDLMAYQAALRLLSHSRR